MPHKSTLRDYCREAHTELNLAGGTVRFWLARLSLLVFVCGAVAGSAVLALQTSPATTLQIQLSFVDLSGKIRNITGIPISTFAPRISPNGKQIVFDSAGVVWIYDLSGNGPIRRLTPGTGSHFPLWSGDGNRILYIADGILDQSLYWRRADGTGEAELLKENARAPESWSPQNNLFSIIMLKGDGDYDVWTLSPTDNKASPLIQIPKTAQHSSKFSPDGHWIAYVSDETGDFEVYVQPFPLTGAKFRITKGGGGHPLWSPDGRTLYYDFDQHIYSVSIRTSPAFVAGDPKRLPISGFIQGPARRQFDMTPDGSQFVMMFPPAGK